MVNELQLNMDIIVHLYRPTLRTIKSEQIRWGKDIHALSESPLNSYSYSS